MATGLPYEEAMELLKKKQEKDNGEEDKETSVQE